jgi:hypothetical protein
MGEPERRRRRLRPSSTSAGQTAAPPGADPPAEPPEGHATSDPSRADSPAADSPAADAPGGADRPGFADRPVPADRRASPIGGRTVTAYAGADAGGAATEDVADLGEEDAAATERGSRPARPTYGRRPSPDNGAGGDEVERGLRGLVGSGSSQVSVGAALRARDAARPTDEQLADADANLAIVRRNWMPREDLPRNR